MMFRTRLALILWHVFLVACSVSSGTSSPTVTTGSAFPRVTGPNTMDITVSNPTTCNPGGGGYANEPCVSVTVCNPGSSTTCVTIPSILLDTGSYGLRVFSSLLTGLTLNNVLDGSNRPVAECAHFASGKDWGPVRLADVILGGESGVTVPIQVIDATYNTAPPSGCTGVDTDPTTAGFNGILGVGMQEFDCGSACNVVNNNLGIYYSCTGGVCSQTNIPADQTHQVMNPVFALPTNNNGVIVTFGSAPATGATYVDGQMVLGIGTQSNNSPTAGTTAYPASTTTLNMNGSMAGRNFTNSAFLDSGSNAVYFPQNAGNQTNCGGGLSGFWCPASLVNLSATIQGYGGSPTYSFFYPLQNASVLFSSGYRVFPNLGGNLPGYLDYGLPFFLGRTVYVVFENKSSPLGTGPLTAF